MDAETFQAKIDRSGDCWNWTGAITNRGYGIVRYGGKVQSTHRLAWELTNGPIEGDLQVLHRCDNRACCRETHLYLGTHQQNMRDVRERLRGNAKLTNEQVDEVRRRYDAGGITQWDLAKEVGISDVVLQRILYRKTVS